MGSGGLRAYEEFLLAKVKLALQALLERSELIVDLAVKKGMMELAEGLGQLTCLYAIDFIHALQGS